ncbi:MAG: ATP-binding protein [Nitrospirota bacterium]|jgi:anti-sigma regulatory factor (Ser/Thr protein kinase)
MEDLSLHILDIVENSITAGANRVELRILEDLGKDIFSIEIKDNGKGIRKDTLEKVTDPFYTTRKTRNVGLGLSLLAQSAKEADGNISIKSEEGIGTTIYVCFKHSHIDRKPFGNIADTLIVLISGNPDIDFFYEHRMDENLYSIDTGEIRPELEGVPINYPGVIELIKKDMQAGLEKIGLKY